MSYNPAFGGVFCYNKCRERKKFPPMKTWQKVALGVLAYTFVKNDLRQRDPNENLVCGTRSAGVQKINFPDNSEPFFHGRL